ncbi:hypothetical protein [Maribacter ulvicola]|nr:hypothetical protein [Maribacter ulvicola]
MKELITEGLKMPNYFISICLVAIVQLNSCKSIAQGNLKDSREIAMELILNENYSGFEHEKYILIKNQKELSAFYGRVNRTRKPGLVMPSIDFNSTMVFIWCGDSTALDYAHITLREKDDFLEVYKFKTKATKDKDKLVVSPFSVYKLPFSTKNLKKEK